MLMLLNEILLTVHFGPNRTLLFYSFKVMLLILPLGPNKITHLSIRRLSKVFLLL